MAFFVYGRNRRTGDAVKRLRIDAGSEDAARAEAAQRDIYVTSIVAAPAVAPNAGAPMACDADDAAGWIILAARIVTVIALLSMAAASVVHARSVRIYYEGICIATIGAGLMLVAKRMRTGRSPRLAALAVSHQSAVRAALLVLVLAVAGYLCLAHFPARLRNEVGDLVPVSLRPGMRDDAKAEAVRKLAQRYGDALVSGDYAVVIDNTYGKIVDLLGGRLAAIKTTKASLKNGLLDKGIAVRSCAIDTPGNFVSRDRFMFTVVPFRIVFVAPQKQVHVNVRSYLLGISDDAGATWKFVDRDNLAEKAVRDVLPALPADLTLPEAEKPQVIHDE